MQRDLARFRRRKRRIRRALAILAITLVAALAAVGARACSDRFKEPYNKGYHPLDEQRIQHQRQGKS